MTTPAPATRPTDVPKVTPTDVGNLLGMSPNHARHLMRTGRIRSWQLGSRLRTTWQAVQEYLDGSAVKPAQTADA